MLIAVLFPVSWSWVNLYMSDHQQTNRVRILKDKKMWYKDRSDVKKNEIMKYESKWIELEKSIEYGDSGQKKKKKQMPENVLSHMLTLAPDL